MARRVARGGRVALLGLVSPAAWRGVAGLVWSLLLAGPFCFLVVLGLTLSGLFSWIVGLGPLVLAGTLRLSARMGELDRRRVARCAGVTVTAPLLPAPLAGQRPRERRRAWTRSAAARRQAAYQLGRPLAVSASLFVAVSWWWLAIASFALASGPRDPVPLLGWTVLVHPGAAGSLLLVLAGLALVLAWPAVAGLLVELDVWLAQALLGPDPRGELFAQVRRLSEARSQAVAAAAFERRRIERDLHDGLQPKLLALALDLGRARARFERDPGAAGELLARAHEDAKATIEDLRALVRGIHPAVLDERGLDAALSALVAACPVPVRLEVALGRRLEREREAAAYFVVAEAIANVVKHAGASQVAVQLQESGASLRVVVADDGRGGAHLQPGGGLAGLAERVAAIDGTLELRSPPGGPTRLEIVLPPAAGGAPPGPA